MLTDDDVRLYDVLTFAYHNFTLIYDMNKKLQSDALNRKKSPLTQYYYEWCEKRLPVKSHPLPLNPGTMWMLASVIIINCIPKWRKFLPKTRISQSASEWGLKRARLSFPKDPDPSIKRVVEKIRNSIAHSRFDIKIEDINVPWEVLINETTFTFKDKDDFEIEVSVVDLSKLSASIYETIGQYITEYMRIKVES